MSRPSNSERDAKIHAAALKSFDRIQSAMTDERAQCVSDRRFYSIAGAMWEGSLGDQFENKPRLEINLIHLAIIRIITEYRANRIDVKFTSKDGIANNNLADVCASLYRADEEDSVAEEAFDNAFEEAVGGGFGAWRLRAIKEDEEDEENEQQRISIEPIFDADSCVFFDLDAKRQDKSDAKECFVVTAMTREAFEAEYPNSPTTWPKNETHSEYDWFTPDVINVAEYYKIEWKTRTRFKYIGLDGTERFVDKREFDEDELLEGELFTTGYKFVSSKKLKKKTVRKWILSGSEILEDCGTIAGKHIPIIPVYGKRWVVGGVERCMGHVRLARDPQMLKNMQVSKLAELAGTSSTEKPIFAPEQVSGHQTMWADDNLKNYPYLLANPILDINGSPTIVGPAAYTKSPQIPPAMAALLQLTDIDMQNILGNPQQGEKIQANVSAEAIASVQNQLGINTAIYVQNFAKAIKRGGQIWLSMAREILVEEGRKMKGVASQGGHEQIELYKQGVDKEGVPTVENAISDADFDTSVEVGPASSSKKRSTVHTLTSLMGVVTDPETLQVLASMAILNSEGEGIQDVRDFFRNKLVKMGAVKPTKEELTELQKAAENQPPDPQAEFLAASAQQAQALAMKAEADTMLAAAKAKLTEAQTAETLASMDLAKQGQVVKNVETMARSMAAQQSADLEDRKHRLTVAQTFHGMTKAANPRGMGDSNA